MIHLRATTDVLMNRIAVRDRPYERTMSRQYIDDLRVAYERFFADYDQGPVLNIDTTDLNFVADADDRRHLIGLVRSALQSGSYQQPLPTMEPSLSANGAVVQEAAPRRLSDFQELHRGGDGDRSGSRPVPGLPGADRASWRAGQPVEAAVDTPLSAKAWQRPTAAPSFRSQARTALRDELTDAFSSLLKIANDAGIDLETAYLDRLDRQPHPTSTGGATK